MSFEPLDTNSIREKINKLKDERINKLISEFENQLNIKIHSRFDDEKIVELKELLEKYDRKDEIQDMVEFGTWKQIDKLKELLREYGEYACQNEDDFINMELKMSFEPMDLNSIEQEFRRLKVKQYENTDFQVFEFVNSSLSTLSLLNEDEKIEKLKNILMKYDSRQYKYELECIEKFEKLEQIQVLKELLKECIIIKNRNEKREKLKFLVTEYKHDHLYPPLPEKPDGSLFGIGFIYDFYKDYILWVITILEDKKNILAVHEHKGTLTIYSKYPYHIQEIDVEGDNWSIFNFVPENGEWIEVERNYN